MGIAPVFGTMGCCSFFCKFVMPMVVVLLALLLYPLATLNIVEVPIKDLPTLYPTTFNGSIPELADWNGMWYLERTWRLTPSTCPPQWDSSPACVPLTLRRTRSRARWPVLSAWQTL